MTNLLDVLHEEKLANPHTQNEGQVIAIIDLGSNSARLLLVQILPNGAYSIINRVKHMVRLGENSFQTRQLQEPAMQRSLLVLRSFMSMCRTYNVTEILPMATAAVRDAINSKDFLQRVHEKTGIKLKVISGKEEARLIYLGVYSSLPFSHALRVIMDIGGGSTEIAVAGIEGYESLDSLKLGCVRLTNRFLCKRENEVSAEIFNEMCLYVRTKSVHVLKRAKKFAPEELIASSGTALALHNIAFRLAYGHAPNDKNTTLTLENLKKASIYICGLTAQERYALPGISIRRAQVLVAGAAILQTLMEELNFSQLTISTRNLQDGILMDYLSRKLQEPISHARCIREQSVLRLAQHCNFEERHARHIANLTLQMHDSAVDCGLMSLDHQGRELLYYTTLLHDIGIFISYARHAAHGAYIIRNTELLGFTNDEIRFMADLTQYHNIKPTKKNELFMQESTANNNQHQLFCLFLSLAENLDRLHCQHVQEVNFIREGEHLTLKISSLSTSPIEVDTVTSMTSLISKAFHLEARICFSSFK